MINISKTTITLSKETRNKLATLGKKDQTFDQIISKLLEGENLK